MTPLDWLALGTYVRLAVDTPVTPRVAGGTGGGDAPGSTLWIVNNIYFQSRGLRLFPVSVAAMVGVSLATAPPSARQLADASFTG